MLAIHTELLGRMAAVLFLKRTAIVECLGKASRRGGGGWVRAGRGEVRGLQPSLCIRGRVVSGSPAFTKMRGC